MSGEEVGGYHYRARGRREKSIVGAWRCVRESRRGSVNTGDVASGRRRQNVGLLFVFETDDGSLSCCL